MHLDVWNRQFSHWSIHGVTLLRVPEPDIMYMRQIGTMLTPTQFNIPGTENDYLSVVRFVNPSEKTDSKSEKRTQNLSNTSEQHIQHPATIRFPVRPFATTIRFARFGRSVQAGSTRARKITGLRPVLPIADLQAEGETLGDVFHYIVYILLQPEHVGPTPQKVAIKGTSS